MRAESANSAFAVAKEWSNEVFIVNNKQYVRLAVIGKGGSSKVFKVLSHDMNIYALKRVNLKGDPSTMESYINEIDLLKRLSTKRNIIKLIDSEVNMQQSLIYLVF